MKKLFYSFVMLVTFVIVAGSAKAQTNVTPYIGSTYQYTLNGVVVKAAGTATISYSDVAHATVPASFAVSPGTTSYSFNITYNDDAVNGTLTVSVQDGTTGCSNRIELSIKPKAKPTLAISIAGSVDDLCQNKKETALTDNTDAVTDGGPHTNSFTFKVSPIVNNVTTNFNYEYSIGFTDLTAHPITGIAITYPSSYSGGKVTHTGVSAIVEDVFTVTFNTKTGLDPQTIVGTITAGSAKLTVPNVHGSGEYLGTITTGTDNVIIKTMPSIGQFTIE